MDAKKNFTLIKTMFSPQSTETKIALLQERISVYEQMLERIDTAIQKIGETSQNISQMLAIHNEKIEQCNRTDNIIVKMMEEIKISSKEQHEEISKQLGDRIEIVEKKIEEISKIKWMVVGIGTLAAIIAAGISQAAGGLVNLPPSSQSHQNHQETLSK